MRRALWMAAGCLAVLVSSCASAGPLPADIAAQAEAIPDTYPALTDVPRTSDANTDAAYWAQVQAELVATGQTVRANPRAQPVTAADDPQLFLEEARRDIEEARLSHEPN